MIFATLFAAAMLFQPTGVRPVVQGAITASDPTAGGEHYDAWPVELHAGHRVSISVTPRGSSATFGLSVHAEQGGRTLALAEGQQLSFTPPANGVYMVRVASDGFGGYTLRIAKAGGDDGAEIDSAGPLERFVLCPGHPRCPN